MSGLVLSGNPFTGSKPTSIRHASFAASNRPTSRHNELALCSFRLERFEEPLTSVEPQEDPRPFDPTAGIHVDRSIKFCL